MENIVKVTRNGQFTIPKRLREKFGIKEGDKLIVKAVEEGILFRKIPPLEQMAGIDAKYGNVDEVKKEMDRIREDY
jgi:AbrB family looped-hinge helix DNA binding protein